MNINAKKLARQQIGVDRWCHAKDYGATKNGIGTLNYCTGVGKTYTALMIFNFYLNKDNTRFIQVAVPSEQLQKDWTRDIKIHISEHLQDRISVKTAHQIIIDGFNIECDLLAVDEIHEFLSEERFKIVKGELCTYIHILGLTATWEDKYGRESKLIDVCPVIDKIDEQEALREGYVSNYIEYNLALDFDSEDERALYDIHTKGIMKNMNKFSPHGFAGASKVLQGGVDNKGISRTGFEFANMWAHRMGWKHGLDLTNKEERELHELWNPNKIIKYAAELMEAVRNRKDLLYTSNSKLKASLDIIKRFPDLKTICFGQSTGFADNLNFMINQYQPDSSVVYHSKLSSTELKDDFGATILYTTGKNKGLPKMFGAKTLKTRAIERIRSGKARRIITASALDKGFDVEDIELGINCASTSNPTQQKQRRGRTTRLKLYKTDTIVIFVNLYIKGTKDYDWLKDRQAEGTNIVYWIDSIEEIRHKYKNPYDDVLI